MNSTITDQIDQTEKPTCSAKIDQIRLRLAILAPPASQASTSSASQCSMLRSRVKMVMRASPAAVGIDLLPTRSASIAPPYRKCQHPLTPMKHPRVRNGIHCRLTGETATKQTRPSFPEGERRQYSPIPAGSVRVCGQRP